MSGIDGASKPSWRPERLTWLVEKTAPPFVAILCASCMIVTKHEGPSGYLKATNDEGYVRRRLLLLTCKRCREPGLFQQAASPEGCRDQGWSEVDLLWPPGPTGQLGEGVPDSIRTEFREVSNAFRAHLWKSATTAVGRVLEAVGHDKGHSGSLATMLRCLLADETIDKRLHAWANDLRILRNDGAHFLGSVAYEDALYAVYLCEAVLNYVYVIQHRYDQSKQRRQPGSVINP